MLPGKEISISLTMSLKRTCSQIFEEPLKFPRIEGKGCRRVSPTSVLEDMQTSSVCSSSRSANTSSSKIDESESEIDYFNHIDLMMERFYEEIQQENRLLSEESHLLSTTHKCSTGLSVVRDFIPVLKIDLNSAFVDQYGRTLSFIECDCQTLFFHLSTSVKRYFLKEGDEEETLLISFNDYRITQDKFLNEKRIKLQWNNKAVIYLTKGEVFKLLDLAVLIGKRMKMLGELGFSDAYYDLLTVLNEIQDPYEKSRVEEVPSNLISKLTSCTEKSVDLLFSEMMVYYPDRIIKDLNKLRCIY